jgi:hypothetical protein
VVSRRPGFRHLGSSRIGRNSAGSGSRAERRGGVRVLERRPMPPLGHLSLIRFELVAGRRRAGEGGGRWRPIAANGPYLSSPGSVPCSPLMGAL